MSTYVCMYVCTKIVDIITYMKKKFKWKLMKNNCMYSHAGDKSMNSWA